MLYHWSYSGWLCESACIMEIGRFPPHSSLFFRKHKSQRDKLLSALSLFVYFHYEKWAGGMHSFHSGGRRAQPQDVHFRLLFPCHPGGAGSWPACWGAARTVLPVQKQLLRSASMPLQQYTSLLKWIQLPFLVHPSMRHTQKGKKTNSDPLPTSNRVETVTHQVTLCEFELAMFCNFPQLLHART